MIYVWNSVALQQYGLGTIAVEADSVESARDLARSEWVKWSRKTWDYMIYDDDTEWIDNKDAEFSADIAKEPTVTGHLFIMGSD